MTNKSRSTGKTKSVIPVKQAAYIILAFGTLVASTMMFFVEPALSRPFFERPFNIYRCFVMLAAIIFLLLATKDNWIKKDVRDLDNHSEPLATQKWLRRLAWGLPILAIIFLAIQLIFPEFGQLLVRKEDWPFFRNAIFVKCACQLVGMIAFIITAINYGKNRHFLAMSTAILIALVLFVMAGEELSWGQRIFGWSTSELFNANAQGETNLHNFATQEFQNTLYFGGWLLLIGFAFFRNCLAKLINHLKPFKYLQSWLPPMVFVLIFAVGFGFGDPLQSETGIYYGSNLFIVLATAAILVAMLVKNIVANNKSLTKWSAIILTTYLVVLIGNLFFSKVWEFGSGAVTEYLEMFISLGLMTWALTVKSRVKAELTD